MGICLLLPYLHYWVFFFVVLESFCVILCVGLLLAVCTIYSSYHWVDPKPHFHTALWAESHYQRFYTKLEVVFQYFGILSWLRIELFELYLWEHSLSYWTPPMQWWSGRGKCTASCVLGLCCQTELLGLSVFLISGLFLKDHNVGLVEVSGPSSGSSSPAGLQQAPDHHLQHFGQPCLLFFNVLYK